MDGMTNDIFNHLAGELDRRSHGARGWRSMERVRGSGAQVNNLRCLIEIAEECLGAGIGAADLLTHLLELAPEDELLALTSLVALRPALRRIARRVAGPRNNREELGQVVLAAAWAAVRDEDVERKPGPVVNRIWTEARSEARRAQRTVAREVLVEPTSANWDRVIEPGWEADFDLLRKHIVRCVLTPEDADLLGIVWFDGVSLREAARVLSVPKSTLEGRLRRAERLVRATHRGLR